MSQMTNNPKKFSDANAASVDAVRGLRELYRVAREVVGGSKHLSAETDEGARLMTRLQRAVQYVAMKDREAENLRKEAMEEE